MNNFLLTLIAALCLTVPVAFGRVVRYEELGLGTVTSLQTCGHWEIDGQGGGEFRVIQGYMYAGTMLFVDMVRLNPQGTLNEVARGFTFEELNDDHYELELSDIRCRSNAPNKITVTGNAEPFESKRFSFRIEIDAASGKYEIERSL